jgi:hypothetical protein
MGTDPTNARLLMLYGNQLAFAGNRPDIKDILVTPNFPDWQLQVMKTYAIRYMVIDRRLRNKDAMASNFFDNSTQIPFIQLIDGKVFEKFSQFPQVSRILDSGFITIFDFKNFLAVK